MKRILMTAGFTILFFSIHSQTTIVVWDFEDQTTQPAEGDGVMELVGGVVEASTAYPQGTGGSGSYAYGTTGYPPQGTHSGTAGIQFTLSTLGFEDIHAGFAVRGSNTASKWAEFQYSIDQGTTWVTVQDNEGLFNNGWQGTYEILLPEETAQQEVLQFRIVTIFEPGTEEYQPIDSGNYRTSGTLRIDDVIFFSQEPTGNSDFTLNSIQIFPNPVTDLLFFSSNPIYELLVTVFDILGNTVIPEQQVFESLDVSNLKKGIYLIKFTSDNQTSVRKFVK